MQEIFSLFALINRLIEQTNFYATRNKKKQKQETKKNFKVNLSKIKKFLGKRKLLISDYHMLPTENDFWFTAEHLQALIYPALISRKDFASLSNVFKWLKIKICQSEKMANALPLIDLLKAKCQHFGVFHL